MVDSVGSADSKSLMSQRSNYVKLSRKWPENPKYKDVKPLVDSGYSLKKYCDSLEEIHRNFKLSPDEIFHRIKLDHFVRLVLEVWSKKLQPPEDELGRPASGSSTASLELAERRDMNGSGAATSTTPLTTAKSTLRSVISGFGEMDASRPTPPGGGIRTSAANVSEAYDPSDAHNNEPYLLLDVRDEDEYNRWRIISATHYPYTMLSRVMNYESKEMLKYKNKKGLLIILCDDDESISQRVACTLVQRGYDNIYILSGGLNLAWSRYSDGLLIGSPKPKSKIMDRTVLDSSHKEFTMNDLHKLDKYLELYTMSTSASKLKSGSVYNSSVGESGDTSRSFQTQRRPWK